MSVGSKRVGWIDCAKTIAIVAVVVDHCYGRLYGSTIIAKASYFSVTLFVLLGGLSAYISSRGRKLNSISNQIKKVGKIFLEYMLATLILLCIYEQRLDLKEYINHVINFSIQGPFYFLLFYFQLMVISPLLISWSRYCESKDNSILWHIGTIGILGMLSSVFINYTFMLPVHGGGKYLFGGTYLLVYYIGIVFGCLCIFETRRYMLIFITTSLVFVVWLYLMWINALPFDGWLSDFWGEGFNPPSINLMILAIIVCFVAFSLFSLLEGVNNKWIDYFLRCIKVIGQNTLYIFMYHLLVRDLIMIIFPDISEKNILIRVIALILIVIAPVIAINGIKQLKRKYDGFMKEINMNI